MSDSKLKIGVIGAGRWGRNIIRTLHQLGVLAAIAEGNESTHADLAQQYPDVTLFANHEDLLAESSIQAVAIATPVVTHFAVARDALIANKDVFVEKPMTMHADQGRQLVSLARERDRVLMVGHMLLYQPAIQFIKSFIDAGKLGRVYSLRQVRRNLGTIRTNENALFSLGVHDLAVLNYLVGEPVIEFQHSEQQITSPDIADDMTVHLKYASGVQAHLHVNWLWPVKDRQLMILGEKGALHYDELAHKVTLHNAHGNADATITNEGSEVVYEGDSQPLNLEMEHFIDCVVSRKHPISPGEQGVAVVELMEKAVAQEKREVVHA